MRKPDLAIVSCIFLLLASLSLCEPSRIVIGSWNIENLGGQRLQEPVELSRHLTMAGAHILALQEIHDTGPGLSNERLEKALAQLEGNWTYQLFPNKPPNEKQRLCGIAWNRDVIEPVGEAFRIPIKDDPNDDYRIWHRHPHARKFRVKGKNKTDFVLISIHQKSNRRPKGKDEHFTRRQRGLEGKTLTQALPQVRRQFKDDDIVIVGDTNCLNAGEPSLVNYRGAGFRDLNILDFNTHHKGRAPFDRFFLPHKQPEFQGSHQIVLSPTDRKGYESRVSDHYLILTTMEVLKDDD